MPRPNPRRPREGQDALFPAPTTSDDMRLGTARHQAAFHAALDEAHDRGEIDAMDGALASTLMAGAWALDSFEAQNKPYGPSKIIDPILNALRAAHMTPDTRVSDTEDKISALLEEIATPDGVEARP